MRLRIVRTTAAACILVFMFFFFFLPIVEVLRGAFLDEAGKPTLVYLLEVFRNPLYLEGLLNSLKIAVCTTAFTFMLALPLAWLGDRYDFPGRKLLGAVVLIPMILPPFVGALGIQRILGRYGVLNSLLVKLNLLDAAAAPDLFFSGGFWGIVVVEALHLYPILYLNLAAAFANVDPLYAEASANLGCVGFRRFRRITLPLVLPGAFAGGTLVCIWSFTELGTPLMFNFERVTPVQVFNGIQEIGSNPFPFALVIVMMVASMVLYLTAKLTIGRASFGTSGKATMASKRQRLRGVAAAAATAMPVLVCAVAMLPHLGVIGMSTAGVWYRTVLPAQYTARHFKEALGHATTVSSIMNSVMYASAAVVLALLIGLFTAFLVERAKIRGAWFFDTLAMLPLAVPGLVMAFGYLAISQPGRIFAFLNPVENPTVLLIIAYAVRRLPFVVRAISAGLQQTSKSLEEAGVNLGASPFRVYRRVTLPLISANIIAGALLAFSFAMLEVADSLVLAQKAAYFPITKAIYELSMLLGEGPVLAAALGVWTMIFLGTSVLIAGRLLGKRMGALFRV